MNINVLWHGDRFSVELSSKEGPFLSVKGCRIVNGAKGPFVSYPARKDEAGKWWAHAWGSDKFNAAVLAKAQAAAGNKPEENEPPF
jgi:DNA-binding cell septation regulator SpoVG